jgi:nicotinamidase-related amidase
LRQPKFTKGMVGIMKDNIETLKYLDYLDSWLKNLSEYQVLEQKVFPKKIGIMVVDMTNGFCNQGALSSARVKAIVNPIAKLLQIAWSAGVRNIFLLNDTHEPDAVEFQSYPPHCIKDSEEAQPVEEIRSLAFYDHFFLIPKNTISSNLGTTLAAQLERQSDLTHFIVVGNCTDLCVYQLGMYLRLVANARQAPHRHVIIPVDCSATYDLGVDTALDLGIIPHPGDLLHAIFLNHLSLNGVEVVKSVKF